MLRKISFALFTAAALGSVALAPTSASAWGRGGSHGDWHGNNYDHNSYDSNSYDSNSYNSYDSYGFRGHDRRR
jgi:hypothetical protein